MKELIGMKWGSSLYGFTNDKSDTDYVIICDSLDDPELEEYKNNPDIEIFNKEQFQKALDSHNIKALEIAFSYGQQRAGGTIDIEDYEFKFDKINKDKLRSEISRVVSNAYVKSKKKFLDKEYYIGAKSYWHCIRILTMFIDLAKQEKSYNGGYCWGVHFDKYKIELDYIYNDIFSTKGELKLFDENLSDIENWEKMNNRYSAHLNNLKHIFKLYCPKGEK
jgi:hypothetical protein